MTQPTMIITGASRGLGAAIAVSAAGQGFRVVLSARNEAALQALAQQIEQAGGIALAVAGDVSRYDDCCKIVERAAAAFGRIDVLINNAAVLEPMARCAEDRHAEWAALLATNLLGPVMLSQLAIPYLRAARGRIIHISSGAAVYPTPGAGAYAASKAALNHHARVLALEEPEITVLSVNPGDMNTQMQALIREKAKGKTTDEIYNYFMNLYEQGNLLPPEKPAQAVVAMALRAPHEWTGTFLSWDDDLVLALS